MAIGTPTERKAVALTSQTVSTAFSPDATVAAGSVAIICCGAGQNKVASSISDTAGNTWVVDKTNADGTRGVSIASAQIATQITTGGTITITWSNATGAGVYIWVQEVTGLATSSVFDTFAIANATGTALSNGPTATLAQADEIAFAVFRHAAISAWTKDAAWSNPTTPFSGVAQGTALEYIIVSATTALTATGTSNLSGAWDSVLATYKGAAAAATDNPYPYVDAGYYPTQG